MASAFMAGRMALESKTGWERELHEGLVRKVGRETGISHCGKENWAGTWRVSFSIGT